MGEIREETSFDTACKSVTALEYTAGGKLLIGCGKGPELFVWDAQTGVEIKRLKGNESPIVKLAHCADTDQVVLCSRDATIRFLDARRTRRTHPYEESTIGPSGSRGIGLR